jgi:hypothetical protein
MKLFLKEISLRQPADRNDKKSLLSFRTKRSGERNLMGSILKLMFILCLPISSFAQITTLDAVRRDYYKVNVDSISCHKLYTKINQLSPTDPIVMAYKGAITATKANFSKQKEEKLKLFSAGKKMLEQAIEKDTTNIELRFLRFTIQSNSPKVLGYYKQLQSDKKYILVNYTSVKNTVLKKSMLDFLMQSALLDEKEKLKIKGTN